MPTHRIYQLCAIFILLFGLIIAQAFRLQVVKGAYYKRIANEKLVRTKTIPTRRGMIVDRNGVVLATDRPSFNLIVVPREIPIFKEFLGQSQKAFRKLDKETVLRESQALIAKSTLIPQVTDALKLEPAAFEERLLDCIENLVGKKHKNVIIVDKFPWDPQTIHSDLNLDQVLRLETLKGMGDAFQVESTTTRFYPHGEDACHVVGYMTRITPEEIDANLYGRIRKDAWIGRSGIEGFYHTELNGRAGERIVEKEIEGKSSKVNHKVIHEDLPSKGVDVKLTLDMNLQRKLAKAYGNHTGSAIVMNPKTGEVLAMFSNPGFDPNLFVSSKQQDRKARQQVLLSPTHPLINRSVQSFYPPGSVFKLITGLAALDQKIVSTGSHIHCSGTFTLGRETKKCWIYTKYGMGHGDLDFAGGIKHSCNPYFYKTAHNLGIDRLAKYAKSLGIGSKTGIDLLFEKNGLMPNKAWKRKAFRDRRHQVWVGGETLSVGIGQGYVQATPIQIVAFMSQIANGGYTVKPYLNAALQPKRDAQPSIPRHFLRAAQKGLHAVVNEDGGTAHRYAPQNVSGEMAGKTSTVQTGGNRETHSWFSGYYPYDKPEIAFVFMAEFAGSGGAICGVKAQQFIESVYGSSEE